MEIARQQDVTPAVIEVMSKTSDPRLREIMVALVTHLHQFVREVRLTEKEFHQAAAIVNEIGQATTDTHNEAVLMAGSLGLSTLVCLLNNGDDGQTETSQSLLGPFWRLGSPSTPNGGSIVRSPTPGPPLFVHAEFRDASSGERIAGAQVDVWHASPVGLYENQDADQVDMNLRGSFVSDRNGEVRFRSVKPAGYPVPTDAVVGRLLSSQGRHPFRPAHLHFLAVKEGYKTLVSQLYMGDDPHLSSDVQFGVTRALIAELESHDGPHPEISSVSAPWFSLSYTFSMERGISELPKPPIK